MKEFYDGYMLITYLTGLTFIITGWTVLYWLFVVLFALWGVTLCLGLYLLKRDSK